jgi:hypothetical protein
MVTGVLVLVGGLVDNSCLGGGELQPRLTDRRLALREL